jgi:hypothetical protein
MNFQQTINAAKSKLAGEGALAAAARWALGVPAKVWLVAAALILAGLWLQEHDARVRRAAELQGLKKQTAVEVSSLQARADAALQQANGRNAAAIAALEAQRRALTARGAALAAELDSLRAKQQKQAEEIATLPPEELETRLTQQLGPSSVVRGPIAGPGSPESGQLILSPQGQRQVASALAERDACRDQSALTDRQLSNCNERLAMGGAQISKQADSLSQLRQALDARTQMEAVRQKQFDAELRAARGTWAGRAVRALKFLAVGAAIGAVLR